MTKITLNNVADLTQPTTAALVINSNNDVIENAMDNTLSRDGTPPNSMRAVIDMDSNRILNLPSPIGATEPLRLQELITFIGGGTIAAVPSGGSTGDALVKTSNTNYAVGWTADTNLITAGTNLQKSGTSPVTLSTVNSPNFPGTVTAGGVSVSGSVAIAGSLTVSSFAVSSLTLNGATSGSTVLAPSAIASGTITVPSATDTLVGKATTDTLTNKTFDTAGTGNVFKINGVTITANTGTGSNVLATSPTLVTPVLGVATATSINKVALTAPATSATLTIADGKTLTINNSLAFNGPDVTTWTFPASSVSGFVATNDSSHTFTNKTYDTAGSGNSFLINGLAATANTGTGSVVRASSPSLTTPTLGVATATSINGNTFTTGTYTLTGTAGKTLTFNNSITLAGTDATTLTFQGTDTYVGRATTDTLTNKTLVAPALGTPVSGTVTNLTGTASININGTVGATTPNTLAFTTGTGTTLTLGTNAVNGTMNANGPNSGSGGGSAFVSQIAGSSNVGMGNYSKLITGGAFDSTPVIYFSAAGKFNVAGTDSWSLGPITASTSSSTGSLVLLSSGGLGVGGAIWAGTYVATTPTTVGALPAAAAGNKGARMFVTDSNAVSFTAGVGAVVAAGGTTNVPVTSDGTNWRIG